MAQSGSESEYNKDGETVQTGTADNNVTPVIKTGYAIVTNEVNELLFTLIDLMKNENKHHESIREYHEYHCKVLDDLFQTQDEHSKMLQNIQKAMVDIKCQVQQPLVREKASKLCPKQNTMVSRDSDYDHGAIEVKGCETVIQDQLATMMGLERLDIETEKNKPENKAEKKCYYCGKKNHIYRECKKRWLDIRQKKTHLNKNYDKPKNMTTDDNMPQQGNMATQMREPVAGLPGSVPCTMQQAQPEGHNMLERYPIDKMVNCQAGDSLNKQ